MQLNIDQYRENDSPRWNVPPFGTPLSAGIMPLFVVVDDQFHHVGTAFLISRFGHFVTAAHCLREAFRIAGRELDQMESGGTAPEGMKLATIHVIDSGQSRHVTLWFATDFTIARPTDLAFGVLNLTSAPGEKMSLALSFGIPAPGKSVRAIGYPKVSPNPIDVRQIRDRTFEFESYQPEVVAAEGEIRGTLIQNYSLVRGPCVLTSAPTLNGMSGGPAIDDQGNVLGVISSSALLEENKQGSVMSLFYPALAMGIQSTMHLHPKVTFKTEMPLIQMIERGLIRSDGSEQMHRIVADGGSYRVDPAVLKANMPHVYDNADGLWEGTPSTRIATPSPQQGETKPNSDGSL